MKVYILNNNADKVFKNKKTLTLGVRELFEKECRGEIKDILIGDLGSICIIYEIEYEETRYWNNYFYKIVNVI